MYTTCFTTICFVCHFSVGIEAWDIDNPVPVDLPSSLPEETFPVSCVTVVKDKVWVGAGPHLYLLENDAFNRTVSVSIPHTLKPVYYTGCSLSGRLQVSSQAVLVYW